jgi:hypothetical protein
MQRGGKMLIVFGPVDLAILYPPLLCCIPASYFIFVTCSLSCSAIFCSHIACTICICAKDYCLFYLSLTTTRGRLLSGFLSSITCIGVIYMDLHLNNMAIFCSIAIFFFICLFQMNVKSMICSQDLKVYRVPKKYMQHFDDKYSIFWQIVAISQLSPYFLWALVEISTFIMFSISWNCFFL